MSTVTALPETECEAGYPERQIHQIVGARYDEFKQWMNGQTHTYCGGVKYNYDTREYVVTCGGATHGPVYYRWDVERFLAGRPVVD